MAAPEGINPRARSYVIWLLGRRDYSRRQLEEKLKKRGLSPDETKLLLTDLIENGWFKEDAYQRVRTRQIIKRGFGEAMIKAKLGAQRIRVEKVDIERAYEELGTTPQAQVKEAVEKYLRLHPRELAGLAPYQVRGKILNALLRKGYRSGEILAALQAILEATAEQRP